MFLLETIGSPKWWKRIQPGVMTPAGAGRFPLGTKKNDLTQENRR